MKIGLLAKRSGKSVHTLRYYEAQRLMPTVSRDAGGQRVYTDLHLSWLDLLDCLRHSGMSIADMRSFTALVSEGDTTLRQRRLFLRAHRERVSLRVRDLEQCVAHIDRKLVWYDRSVKTKRR
jgi:DNA-binding transcriptional MerR regulator